MIDQVSYTGSEDVDWSALDHEPVLAFNLAGSQIPWLMIRTWDKREAKNYARLANCIGPSQPIFTVLPPMSPEDYPRTTREWAERTVKLLPDWITSSEFLFGGWSFGGVIALEVAQLPGFPQPEMLFFLDSRIPSQHPIEMPTGALHAAARRVTLIMDDHTNHRDRLRLIWESVGNRVGAIVYRREPIDSEDLREERRKTMSARRKAIWTASLKYTPREFNIPVFLCVTDESTAQAGGDLALGWSRFARSTMYSVAIVGTHRTMFDDAGVASIVRAFQNVSFNDRSAEADRHSGDA